MNGSFNACFDVTSFILLHPTSDKMNCGNANINALTMPFEPELFPITSPTLHLLIPGNETSVRRPVEHTVSNSQSLMLTSRSALFVMIGKGYHRSYQKGSD
eukprot:4054779-Amphidinium_carterae.1